MSEYVEGEGIIINTISMIDLNNFEMRVFF